jgi:hypothetical protein
MRLLIIVFFFFCLQKSFSQNNISYASVDSATYVEYSRNDFNAIKETGKKALKEGIDFYDFRMRLAILGYNEKNYEYALQHFEAAYAMNPANEVVQEYLYYTYFFSGRTENANALAASLSTDFQKKFGYVKKKLDSIILSGGTYMNSNIKTGQDLQLLGQPYVSGYLISNGVTNGGGIVIENTFGNRLHFYNKVAGYQTKVFAKNEATYKDFANQSINRNLHSEKNYSNLQYQYNTGLAYQFQNGLLLGVGGAFFQTNTKSFWSTAVKSPDGLKQVFVDSILPVNYSNYLASFSIGKRMKYIFPQITGTYSNLYETNQYQGEVSLSYFPLGNMKLFGTTSFAYIDNNKVAQNVFSQKIGYVVSKNLWLEAKYSTGNHMNYMSSLGFVSYNTPDAVQQNIGIDLHITLKKLELILSYSQQIREGSYTRYTQSGTLQNLTYTTNSFKYNYTNNNITTTIKWNF